MPQSTKIELGSLEETLDKVPYSITLSNISAPDAPLIFMNKAFRVMTGCDNSHIGQNCRFLQGDFENGSARAEINLALSERRRTQVVLKNQRMDSTPFYNLLMLEHVGQFADFPDLVLGTQFVLNEQEQGDLVPRQLKSASYDYISDSTLRVRLERRRIASDSTLRLLQSWCILRELGTKA